MVSGVYNTNGPVQTASKKASEKSGAFFISGGKVTNIMTNIFQLDSCFKIWGVLQANVNQTYD